MIKYLIFFILCCMLASCGQSGHLYLPEDSATNTPPTGN